MKAITVLSRAIGALFCCALVSAAANAATITISPSADTTIYQGVDPLTGENFEVNSCGAGSNFFVGNTNDGLQRRTLVSFDIAAAVPAGSTINSVTLTMEINRSGDNVDAPMELAPVQLAWGEGLVNCDSARGGGTGLPAETGDATWLDAEFQLVNWGTAGGDYTGTSASATVGTAGSAVWDSAANPAMVTDVQAWLDTPAGNFGWIVIGDESRSSTTRRIFSREGRTPPTLIIDFTPTGDVYACCFADGACTITDTTSCTDNGGTPDTNTSSCGPNPCPQPTGACCNLDESCSENIEREACEAAGGLFNGAGSACSQGSVDCGLEPFVDELPYPAVLQPVGTRSDGVPQYEVTMTEENQVLHRDLPATEVWTYNGTFPGPTIEAVVDQPIEVKYINSLPSGNKRRGNHALEVDECPHGPNYWQDTARTVPHLHGGHVPARFDGQPEYDFMPGAFDTYVYPNNQLPATLWYHDHALGITRLNVYMGMAAYYLLRDPAETGEELLPLPRDFYDVPIVVQDRTFNPDGSFFYPPTLQDAFYGDKILANGKVWPFMNVDQGKYRFRFLNGSQARVYKMRLENLDDPAQVIPFYLIGTDGGLITAPISLADFTMAPAERFDVVVDFESFPAGTEIVLRNDNGQVPIVTNVMKFIVGSDLGDTVNLPSELRLVAPIEESEATETRWFNLKKIDEPCAGQEWVIETLDGPDPATAGVLGKHWDDITDFPLIGATEIWEFINTSNMMHPMHVHLVQFQVLERIRLSDDAIRILEPWELNTWKDTVRVPPGHKVRIIARFENYAGRFPYHCHILDHEDHEMMRQFQTVHDPADCNSDGICDPGEDCVSCPGDCGSVSGALCGNGLCETGDGENFDNCSADCAGKTKGKDPYKCGAGTGYVNCSEDARCTDGFFCREMPRLSACCGDSLCEGLETESTCAVDCSTGQVGSNCSQILDRGTCNDDPGCEWQGGPRNGSCVESSGGGECTPDQPGAELTCDDGVDNDCDGQVDCADSDCGEDPACAPQVDCSQFGDKNSCNAEATCRWDNKNKVCVPN
jgi:spore coat protein A